MVFIPEKYANPVEPEFRVDPTILAIRRYQAEVDRLNAPPIAEPEAGEVGEVPAVKPPTKTEQARAWLAGMLRQGPVAMTVIEAEGRKAGFTLKMLKDVKKKMRVVSVRKGANHWRWRLPMANEPKDDGE